MQLPTPPSPRSTSHNVHCPIHPKPRPSHITHIQSLLLAQVWTLSRNIPPYPPFTLLELRQNIPEAQGTGRLSAGSWYNFGQELE